MSLAPPYIPRSIRQIDQSNPDGGPSEPIHDPGFRVTDVNSWLHSIQNQAVSNVSAQTLHANLNALAPSSGNNMEMFSPPNAIMEEAPPGREFGANGISQSPRVEENEDVADSIPPARSIEFSSTPLADDYVSGGQSVIDTPIVLGGERVSVGGSRPNSARPSSSHRNVVCIHSFLSLTFA